MWSSTLAAAFISTFCIRSTVANFQYGGVNIAGFEFGVDINGAYTSDPKPPLKQYSPDVDGVAQMQHFVAVDGFNTFRLPVSWQYLVNRTLGGPLDPTNFGRYDELVQACLGTGATCIIDIHNYARWESAIVGQGGGSGPTNDHFASLWSQLATHYASSQNLIFGLMNEPHDIPSLSAWATTVQTCVSAIRSAGATGQTILLPANGWTGLTTLLSQGGYAELSQVVNPEGGNRGLVFDVHMYYDGQGGKSTECSVDNVADSIIPLATRLRQDGRKAFLSETGGGNTQSCVQVVGKAMKALKDNSDVYVGFTAWSAGSFDPGYELSALPGADGKDGRLVSEVLAPAFAGANASAPVASDRRRRRRGRGVAGRGLWV